MEREEEECDYIISFGCVHRVKRERVEIIKRGYDPPNHNLKVRK